MKSFLGQDYVSGNCTSADRILLVNAPVIESRYQWVRWNQPLDLLKIGTFLKTEIGCDVKLFDFMLPLGGRVARTANKPDSKIEIDSHTFSLWRYGKSNAEFSSWLEELTTDWRPTQIWITSLTSYWWRGVSNTIARLKNRFNDVPIVLYGRYAQLEESHAKRNSFADVLIQDRFDLTNYLADFDLYEPVLPSFCALDIHSRNWQEEVGEKLARGISNFVFFNDPLIVESNQFIESMERFLNSGRLKNSRLRPKFYALCGLNPRDFTSDIAEVMRAVGFTELHFEYELEAGALNRDAYRQVKKSLQQSDYDLQPDELSGFVYIGLPNDDLSQIIKHVLNLLEVFGSVMLKPWSPTPDSELYCRYQHRIETEKIELMSPHFFPFSCINGITPADYEELYVLVAALNQKVRSQAFGCFPGTLAYEMIRGSLSREVWNVTG